MNPSRQALEAAMKLRAPELKPFVEWLKADRAELMEHLAVAPRDRVETIQGKVQALQTVLTLIETASAQVDKLEGRKT